ncbi:hypothetical protein SKAU_G00039440 [Synaphobranchus kaupii]|uniref:Uncharacterized protein n=1 Tax=Synaphobranchus kaupii TaxID=118154 RepID=A0A9Q1GH30_SYNKA|nr:hypothetical protein SKAU_G00039440 [Synaphobranchus kaupii]
MASNNTCSKVKDEPLENQDREEHKTTHTFSFCERDGRPYSISCSMAGTVLEALNTSKKFTSLVFGMHTGGFMESDTKSVIEYAHPLSAILKDILRKLTENKMPDVLTKFIQEAKTQDSLHPVIADFITFLGQNWEPCHEMPLYVVINTVESDAYTREHCWRNILKDVSENVKQGLKMLLFTWLGETQGNEYKLYQLLPDIQPMQ